MGLELHAFTITLWAQRAQTLHRLPRQSLQTDRLKTASPRPTRVEKLTVSLHLMAMLPPQNTSLLGTHCHSTNPSASLRSPAESEL